MSKQVLSFTRGLGRKGFAVKSLALVLALLFVINASAYCPVNYIRCRCDGGRYELVTKEEYRKRKTDPDSCCYFEKNDYFDNKPTTIVNKPGEFDLVKKVDSDMPVEATRKPDMRTYLIIKGDEGKEERRAYLAKNKARFSFLSVFRLPLPIRIHISNFLSSGYNIRL